MAYKDQVGFDFWIAIKQKIRKYEKQERITKLEFQTCQLRIDENLFSNPEHSYLPIIEELAFDNTGEISLMDKGLYTVGNTTIIFRNDPDFRLNYRTNLFNHNVTKVIFENLKVYDFSSDFFRGLSDTSSVHLINCHLVRSTEHFQTRIKIKISSLVVDNVTLDHSINVKPFLRLSGLQEAKLTNINWNFEKMFKNRGIIFEGTSKLCIENSTLSGFRAITGGVKDVILKR